MLTTYRFTQTTWIGVGGKLMFHSWLIKLKLIKSYNLGMDIKELYITTTIAPQTKLNHMIRHSTNAESFSTWKTGIYGPTVYSWLQSFLLWAFFHSLLTTLSTRWNLAALKHIKKRKTLMIEFGPKLLKEQDLSVRMAKHGNKNRSDCKDDLKR